MRKRGFTQYIRVLPLAALLVLVTAGPVFAETSSQSPNYELTESQFNGGSAYESCSDTYCARASLGDPTADGPAPASSASFAEVAQDTEPLMEMIVDSGESRLGVLSTQTTATKTMTVRIRSYLGGGYNLQIMGDPPKYEGHLLKTSNTPIASLPGTEQFGINVVANTSPAVGADPQQVPSAETSFGEVMEQYDIPNWFKYRSGATVARSLSDSGRTDYTVTMIVNISSSTPAGEYAGDFAAVVIPAF